MVDIHIELAAHPKESFGLKLALQIFQSGIEQVISTIGSSGISAFVFTVKTFDLIGVDNLQVLPHPSRKSFFVFPLQRIDQ